MLFAVIFHDHPGQGDFRAAHAQAHIDWLAAHADTVRVAGSLRETPDQVPKGGLWIVEAPDSASVQKLLETDPFWTCGLREGVEVLIWRKAFDQPVLV